jgi:hypothetical protein
MGGPIEGPSGMSWEDFKQWRESGQWWKESVYFFVKLAIIPVIIASLITLVTLRRKREQII